MEEKPAHPTCVLHGNLVYSNKKSVLGPCTCIRKVRRNNKQPPLVRMLFHFCMIIWCLQQEKSRYAHLYHATYLSQHFFVDCNTVHLFFHHHTGSWKNRRLKTPSHKGSERSSPSWITTSWWFQPLRKILVKMGIFPQLGVKIRNIWNHHPDNNVCCYSIFCGSLMILWSLVIWTP